MRFQTVFLLLVNVLWAQVAFAQAVPDESEVVAKIELIGGKIERDDTLPNHPVVGVSFAGSQRFNDKFVHVLKGLPSLKTLDLSGTKVTDAGLKSIPELRNLAELNLYESGVTRNGVAELRKSAPNLWIYDESSIVEAGGRVSGVTHFKGRHIVAVTFANSPTFGDESLRLVKPLKSLTMLDLSYTPITGVGLKDLCSSADLKVLMVGYSQFTNESLKELKEFKSLTQLQLQLQNTQITDEGLKDLKGLKNLTTLLLFGNQITDAGLKELKELQHIDSLYLSKTKITDSGLTELRELRNLKDLGLSHSQITDVGLKVIGEFKKLNSLNISSSQITDAGLKELSRLKQLVRLELRHTPITDDGLKALSELNVLSYLNLANTKITDRGLEELSGLKQLRMLDIRSTKITKEGEKRFRTSRPKVQFVQ